MVNGRGLFAIYQEYTLAFEIIILDFSRFDLTD